MATPDTPRSRLPIPSPRISRIPQPTRAIPGLASPIQEGRARRHGDLPGTPTTRTAGCSGRGEASKNGRGAAAAAVDSARPCKGVTPTTPSRLDSAASSSLRSPARKPATNKTSVDTLSCTTSGKDVGTPVRSSIREQIAARRKALREGDAGSSRPPRTNRPASANDVPSCTTNTPRVVPDDDDDDANGDIFGRTIPKLIRKGMTTGRLDVANMSLSRLPRELWTRILNLSGDDLPDDLPSDDRITIPCGQAVSEANDFSPEEAHRRRRAAEDEIMRVPFYQVEDLSVIRASGNEIRVIEPQIGLIGGLKVLDVHGNQLRELPDSLINLRELTTLDVSDNHLTAFPPSLILAPSLTHLVLARNALTSLSWLLPIRPNPDLLKTRRENSFFDAFPSTPVKSTLRDADEDTIMPCLKMLDLSGNRITTRGLPTEWPASVELVDLSDNALSGLLDCSTFARLPRLKRLVLRRNAITGVRVCEEPELWRALECIDLEGNQVTVEDEVTKGLNLGRAWTTGPTETEGAVRVNLEGNPIVRHVVKKPHPATIVERPTEQRSVTPTTAAPYVLEPLVGPVADHPEASGPFVGCWNAQQQSIVITRDLAPTYLDDAGVLDLAHIAAAVPSSSTLRSIEVSGILQLKGLHIPRDARLASVTCLAIINTSLRIEHDFLGQLAKAMPHLETLDLSGSRIQHITGAHDLCANGLKRLLVKGCRIADISSLVDVAQQLHMGKWLGALQLEEVDIRDNEVPKLDAVLGCLPLRSFLVENNAFRVPHRRIWEREGTAGLLRWLREGL
ncbi:hypothetical protein NliqN6_3372 [Naganishia liquefaciens]|uniref:Leucine-rich repeat domain-containing protein n=1 Tax=Naganishia liquefaciens TaxID=104408 RepID=A0A8H3TUJ8_9TREE|nr:hypothetical protein NliqN6_3372 [Naganishia liquefaciens]